MIVNEVFDDDGLLDNVLAQADTRRPPLPTTMLFRIRIDIGRAKPPIWRRVEVHSDLTLLDLHRIIQGAFGWYDDHLYRFWIGDRRNPYNGEFLSMMDLECEGEVAPWVGEVRIDETIHAAGDIVNYVYDYGDDWQVKIKLEAVEPLAPETPPARCIAGRRAGPPEDSGGIADGGYLADLLPNPAHFDLDETNAAILEYLDDPDGSDDSDGSDDPEGDEPDSVGLDD